MARPKKIVLASDQLKRFGSEVFDLIRTKLAPGVGGNVNLAVKLAAEHFAPRKPGEVKAEEMEGAISQIAAKFEKQRGVVKSDDGGRLPLNDAAQTAWDEGKWKGKLTVHGLRQKYAAEIRDGVDITSSMVEAYAAELAAEKEVLQKIVDEKSDPNSGPVTCGAPDGVHVGERKEFQPTVRFRPEKGADGTWGRKKHPQGDSFIVIGNFLVVPADDEEGSVDRAVPYCASCREKAWSFGRETETKVTFYSAEGAQRKLGRMKESAEGHEALGKQLKSAAARIFGGGYYGPRKEGDWRRTRGSKK